MITEKVLKPTGAFAMMLMQFIGFLIIGAGLLWSMVSPSAWAVLFVLLGIANVICLGGYAVVAPNQALVLTLFGKYIGTVKEGGFWWINPFTMRRTISLRIRNFESGKLKVNDHDGNPIEIGAIVVWQVVETAEAVFNVESYENFLQVQSEAAIRTLASSYPYEAHQEDIVSLRGNTDAVTEQLKKEIQERLSKAGVQVIEARIAHLAYAPEIASAMLRRQQANAIIAARQRIVEGAVSMVEMALDKIEEGGKVRLDDERKASMVSNLLVVLVSDKDAQPIVNTGTIYS
jgi:regulator of protease activity HflC (stomatin/prohibitin superfamily)